MKLFGKAKKAPPPKDSIQKLRGTTEMLEKREVFLQRKIEQQQVEAKKCLQAKNKRGALMCLKRRKAYEAQIDKISAARMTIEQQMMAIEGANVSAETLSAMKMGAQTLQNMHKNMKVDDVDDTMEDIREQMEVANEINEAIAQPLGMPGFELDEDDLAAELEELEQENLDETMLNISAPTLPVVPSGVPTAAEPAKAPTSAEDAQLAALEASMAM